MLINAVLRNVYYTNYVELLQLNVLTRYYCVITLKFLENLLSVIISASAVKFMHLQCQ